MQKKRQSKTRFNDPNKRCTKLAPKLLTYAYKPKVKKFKSDNDPQQIRVYFLSFVNSLFKMIKSLGNVHVAYELSIDKSGIFTRLC